MATGFLERYKAKARQTIADPVRFSSIVLKHNTWDTPAAIMRSVAENKQTSVKACHSSSKTFSAADLVLWWLIAFQNEGAKAITTAPGWAQVKDVMWSEIRRAAEGSKLSLPTPLKARLELSADCFAIGLSTNEHMRFAGYKGQKVLIVIDEAPGVRGQIWDAIDGLGAGGDVHVLALGQPMVPGGPYYDTFHKDRAMWATFTIDAFDTPNLRGVPGRNWEEKLERILSWHEEGNPALYNNERSYLCTRDWIRRMHEKWTTKHFYWSSRVRGAFPDQSEDSLVPLSWLEAANTHDVAPEEDKSEGVVCGVDPAAEGESLTVMYVRQRNNVIARHEWADPLPIDEVVRVLERYPRRVRQVNVDVVGVGYGMAQALQQQGFRVAFVNVGLPARDTERFFNQKAELYWGLRDRFRDGHVTGVLGDDCVGQLATIKYGPNPRNQTVIESKDKLAKRGIPSPDHAEALMLAFADVPVRGGTAGIKIPRLLRKRSD